jgi:hypothetical protein
MVPSHKSSFSMSSVPVVLRVGLLIGTGFFCLAVLSSWVLHLPLLTGRSVLGAASLPINNDMFSYPLGLLLCWGACYLLHIVAKDVLRSAQLQGMWSVALSIGKYVLLCVKILVVGALWSVVPPLLVGFLLEAIFVVPVRVPLYETPKYSFVEGWAVGFVLLKLGAK